MGRFFLIIGALFFIMAADKAGASDPENQIFLDLKDGRVVIDLLPDVAPKHVAGGLIKINLSLGQGVDGPFLSAKP